MRSLSCSRRIAAAVVALSATVATAACSASQAPISTVAPVVARNALAQQVIDDLSSAKRCSKSKIYVADYAASTVEIYPQGVTNPSPCATISKDVSFPEALFVDHKGTLYVANYESSSVTEYLPGRKIPTLSIATASPPFDVSAGVDGTLYVAESDAQTVAEYAPGSTQPSLVLALNGGPHGVATDNANNLYVSYLSNADGVSHVEKFAPKATTGTDLGFTVSFAGELKLDTKNDIIIGDRNSSTMYVYPPGHTTPSRSFSTPLGKPVNFALNKAEDLLYVSGLSAVDIIDYHTGASIGSIGTGLRSPSGVALSPPAPY